MTVASRGLLLRGVGGSRTQVAEPFMLGGVVRTYSEPFDLMPGQVAFAVVEPFEVGVTAFRTIVEPFSLIGVASALVVEPFSLLGPTDATYEDGAIAQPRIGITSTPTAPIEILV